MTRPNQEKEEREILDELLSATGIRPECGPTKGEQPDFMMQISGLTVGVEVVMYQSGKKVTGGVRRAVEAEWECFERYSKVFRKEHYVFVDMYVLFRFKNIVPSRRQYEEFCQEILQFVCSKKGEVSAESVVFGVSDFTSPLMRMHLKAIGGLVLKRCERDEWDSNITAGFVDSHPVCTISKIVAKKTILAKTYRRTDELWLVIGQSGRLSEMVLPINGASEFDASLDVQESLSSSPFSRVYVFTAMGLFRWDKRDGKWQPNARAAV